MHDIGTKRAIAAYHACTTSAVKGIYSIILLKVFFQWVMPEFLGFLECTILFSLSTDNLPSAPPFGYPDMAPPSYASAVGEQPINIADDDDKYTQGNLTYIPVYTFAQPRQVK